MNQFLLDNLKKFIKSNPEAILGLEFFKFSLVGVLNDALKLLEILQIYHFNFIIESNFNTKRTYFLAKYSCEILHCNFFSEKLENDDFIPKIKEILKKIIQSMFEEEKKSILLIEISSKKNNKTNYNLDYFGDFVSIITAGVNFNTLYTKNEMKEILVKLNEYKELDCMKLDHKLYKVSKMLTNSIKIIISIEKNNNIIGERISIIPNYFYKSFVKVSMSELLLTVKDIKDVEDLITLKLSPESIKNIEFAKNLEMVLSPNFEDFYHYNLLKKMDFYAINVEILSTNIKNHILEKNEHIKSSTLYGRMIDFIKKNIANYKNQLEKLEKNILTLDSEIEKNQNELVPCNNQYEELFEKFQSKN